MNTKTKKMKKTFSVIATSILFCLFCQAQNKPKTSLPSDSIPVNPSSLADKPATPTKDTCHCNGTSFDTCCKVKKICCETKLIDSSKDKNYYILQKNFADAEPFAFKDLILKNRKNNLCIRICNINRIAFDITANGEIVKTNLPDTGIFDGLAKMYKDAGGINIPTSESGKKDGKQLELLEIIPDSSAKKLGRLEELKEDIQTKKEIINKTAQSLSADLKNLDRFARFAKNAPVIVGSECCSQQKIKDRLGNQADIKAYKSDISYDNLSRIINTDIPLILEDAKQKAEEINTLKEKIKQLITDYKKDFCTPTRTAYGKGKNIRYFTSIPEECEKINLLADLDNSDQINETIKIAQKANKDELAKSISAINDLLAMVDNENNFFFTTCFDRDEAEFVNVLFKAIPKDGFKNKLDSQVYKYFVPVKGRFKWAIGPSLNFHLGSSLMNNTFSIDSARRNNDPNGPIMTDTFQITKNALRSKIIPYIGFMAHFYWQTHKSLTPGISIGVSTSPTQLSELRAYLGGSLIIGGAIKGKLIFSAGLAGSSVDRLKPNLVEGLNPKNRIIFNGNNLPSADQLVEKVFKVGIFFGMTYNLKD